MVQKTRTSAFLLVSFLFFGFGCGSVSESGGSRIIGGGTPLLVSADPTEASIGSTVEVRGSGFSFVPAENILSVGGASVPASAYFIDDDGNQVLSFEIPEDAPQGDQALFAIVQSNVSNTLTMTVNP
jgi:hypothetical protein